jgi:chromosome segregation ATPase
MKSEIATLEEEVAILQTEVKTGQEIIVKLEVEKEEFRQEAVISHKLVAECQQSAVSRTEEVLHEKDKEILQLKHQLSSATSAKESYEQKLGSMKKKMRVEADEERRVL